MKNNDFGAAIAQARKEKGITQKELAEQLHVSDKAVSRWETGKNYPDVETLQSLAEVLQVSVGDLLQGDLEPAKKAIKWKKIFAAALVLLMILYICPFYHYFMVGSNVYGARESSYLFFRGTPWDIAKVSHIMDTAEAAFSELGLTNEEADAKYGALSRYCITSDYDNVVAENHSLKLWSVRLNTYTAEHKGYMWVYYSQKGLTKDGETSTAGMRIPAVWYLDKDENGEWYVTDIKEAP